MQNAESLLVIVSFVFMTVLFVWSRYRKPKSNFLDWYTGKNVKFDKSQSFNYWRLVAGTAILSVLCGYLVDPTTTTVLWFTGLNTAMAAVTGVGIFLYKPLVKK
jgi:Ca2+/Na+ antiporter